MRVCRRTKFTCIYSKTWIISNKTKIYLWIFKIIVKFRNNYQRYSDIIKVTIISAQLLSIFILWFCCINWNRSMRSRDLCRVKNLWPWPRGKSSYLKGIISVADGIINFVEVFMGSTFYKCILKTHFQKNNLNYSSNLCETLCFLFYY